MVGGKSESCFLFQKKCAPSSQAHAEQEIFSRSVDDEWARRLYGEALRCREQDGEDEALEDLRALSAGLRSAAGCRDLWRL